MIQKLLINIDYWIKNSILKRIGVFLFKQKIIPNTINHILIFRTGSLGDSICTLPALEAIRANFKTSKITILTHAGNNHLVSIKSLVREGLADGFIFYKNQSYQTLIKQLRQEKYDLFVMLPQAHAPFQSLLRNLFFAKIINVRHAIGFNICVTRLFPQTQANLDLVPNVRDYFLSLLTELKIPLSPFQNQFKFSTSSIDQTIVDSKIEQNRIGCNNKYIAIVVGAKRPQNRWPIEYFNEIINYLINLNYSCLLIGGPEDTQIAKQLKKYNEITDFTGQLSPIQSGILLSKCLLVITNDTGPMHLAYAFGSKVIALFSSRDYPTLWFPPKENSFVFRTNQIHCSECFTETCTDNQCMKKITPSMVIEQINKELKL